MKKRSKRYKELIKSATKDKKLTVKEILELVKKNSNSKLEESIDISLRINLKQSKGGDLKLRFCVNKIKLMKPKKAEQICLVQMT